MTRHHITLDLDLDEVPPLKGDRSKLHQVLNNLLTNAKEALQLAPVSQRRIELLLKRDREDILLEVSDNPVVVDPDDSLRRAAEENNWPIISLRD